MVMENNTLLSHELEEMRSQINLLKEQLDKQTIVNDRHIRNSMKAKASDMSRIIRGSIIGGIFAVLYCPVVFILNDFSPAFIIVTAVMLAVCFALTVYQYRYLKKVDFSQGSLVEIAKAVGKLRKHYGQWTRITAPLIIIPWVGWLMYESIMVNTGVDGMIFCVGALVGAVVGGIVGYSLNRKVISKADEILSQLEDLQKDE